MKPGKANGSPHRRVELGTRRPIHAEVCRNRRSATEWVAAAEPIERRAAKDRPGALRPGYVSSSAIPLVRGIPSSNRRTRWKGDGQTPRRRRPGASRGRFDPATPTELRAPTNGAKWTNEQLLFRMLFGFLLVRALLILVKGFGRLPGAVSRAFAAALDAGTRPFHVANYLCALPGGRVLRGGAMGRLMGRTIGHLRASLARESDRTLALALHFPIGWDPYFKYVMTVADVYGYPIKHYDHHRRQLTTRRALGTRFTADHRDSTRRWVATVAARRRRTGDPSHRRTTFALARHVDGCPSAEARDAIVRSERLLTSSTTSFRHVIRCSPTPEHRGQATVTDRLQPSCSPYLFARPASRPVDRDERIPAASISWWS